MKPLLSPGPRGPRGPEDCRLGPREPSREQNHGPDPTEPNGTQQNPTEPNRPPDLQIGCHTAELEQNRLLTFKTDFVSAL
ncbi:hypothetical protein EYF80_033009 [Liparis tanakae]|uniref:Uncharacterized protein n=1 Tax=Liparis tanakae TaxID=230148 RepID=A0A4Z2GTT7_9TELE|nr:hypothetical protein EYF80_033009 [Liparis tanakae]